MQDNQANAGQTDAILGQTDAILGLCTLGVDQHAAAARDRGRTAHAR